MKAEGNLLPTNDDIKFFNDHGWYISPPVLENDLIEDAYHGAMRYYAGERDIHLPLSGGFLDWKKEQGNILRINDYVSLQNEELRTLVLQPIIGAIASKLINSKEIRLFHDQLLFKPPVNIAPNAAVGWHVDKAYWKTCTSENMLTAWIPFQDCSSENGTLCVVDKSHTWKNTQQLNTFNNMNLDVLDQLFDDRQKNINIIPIQLKKGQISFHHCRTIHGSYPNRSNENRIALAIHMQDKFNKYNIQYENDTTVLHVNDLLCRKTNIGVPDYSDPDICPLLWKE
ncbi:phytanoyl-CoA dioxygenase family protein [Spirosoma areae]